MHEIRRADERGFADHGWLKSYHSFSFANYYDPEHMGFGPLRVINEDRVAGGGGFGKHPHNDMEIISYVLSGELEHKDSMGNGSVIRPGDVQRMSAGTGVVHSEFNQSETDTVHFLQIWILPDQQGIQPDYQQKFFPAADKRGRLCIISSPDGRGGSVRIQQDALIYSALVDGDERVSHELSDSRQAYVHVACGKVTVNGEALNSGDALMIRDERNVTIGQGEQAEVLLFDLPL
jgi:redox-sensitive bicupin YhaK (pirin superfamily)